MANTAQTIPPKTAKMYADRARDGDYHHKIGDDIYEFYNGRTAVCLVCLDPPIGHVRRMSVHEAEEAKARVAARGESSPRKGG